MGVMGHVADALGHEDHRAVRGGRHGGREVDKAAVDRGPGRRRVRAGGRTRPRHPAGHAGVAQVRGVFDAGILGRRAAEVRFEERRGAEEVGAPAHEAHLVARARRVDASEVLLEGDHAQPRTEAELAQQRDEVRAEKGPLRRGHIDDDARPAIPDAAISRCARSTSGAVHPRPRDGSAEYGQSAHSPGTRRARTGRSGSRARDRRHARRA